jgi:hypothetical protein
MNNNHRPLSQYKKPRLKNLESLLVDFLTNKVPCYKSYNPMLGTSV